MPAQLQLDEALLLGLWLESVAYGFFLCLFCGTMVLSFGRCRRRSNIHSKIMIGISCVMFFISTLHLILGIHRLCQTFVRDPGGVAASFANVMEWEDVVTNVLYGTQELLGNAAAVYRCYILWNKEWRIIVLPLMLLVGSLVSGGTIAAALAIADTPQDLPTDHSVKTFYSIAVVQTVITTGLMGFRIWRTSSVSAKYYKIENTLLPIIRVLIESAALQLIVEILTLALYAGDLNAALLPQGLVTPIVGITFNAIAIRIKLRTIRNSTIHTKADPVKTIGSIPMKRTAADSVTEIDVSVQGNESSTSTSSVPSREITT
ncbi:hypothetical protein BDN71DRAFT_1450831 [Pleurotus eryngii]|uniref:Uncharacterized protein n=1 Tax=Pleurotus eryngii TaxID=5323 RepID=A0A9P5ZUM2_PLEER|nr:hypothetical protein BDN71DRAFT_1450831 [Pleurotus eryngii]